MSIPAMQNKLREEGDGSTVITIPPFVRRKLGLEPGERPDIDFDHETRKIELDFSD